MTKNCGGSTKEVVDYFKKHNIGIGLFVQSDSGEYVIWNKNKDGLYGAASLLKTNRAKESNNQ